jgi:hypothetical protein
MVVHDASAKGWKLRRKGDSQHSRLPGEALGALRLWQASGRVVVPWTTVFTENGL